MPDLEPAEVLAGRTSRPYPNDSAEYRAARTALLADPRGAPDPTPLWNILNLTPAGRGTDWYPALAYE